MHCKLCLQPRSFCYCFQKETNRMQFCKRVGATNQFSRLSISARITPSYTTTRKKHWWCSPSCAPKKLNEVKSRTWRNLIGEPYTLISNSVKAMWKVPFVHDSHPGGKGAWEVSRRHYVSFFFCFVSTIIQTITMKKQGL